MNNCSICGWGVAWCVDKEDKGTYWLCGRCAVDYYRDKIKSERVLLRVARAATNVPEYIECDCICGVEEEHRHCPYCGYKETDGHWKDCVALELAEALKELPEGLID